MGKWGAYAKQAQSQGGGGGLFVRLDDGDEIRFLVMSAAKPYIIHQRWNEDEGKYETVDGPGKDIQTKIQLPVFDLGAGQARILNLTPNTFMELGSAIDDPEIGGEGQVYRVKRTGSGMKTRYKVDRLREATPDQVALVARQDVPDLDNYGGYPLSSQNDPEPRAQQVAAANQAAAGGTEDIPF